MNGKVWAVVAIMILAGGLAAAEVAPLTFESKRLVVFKDGYCLFVKEAPVSADAEGIAVCDAVPDSAILGAFWAVPSKGRIVSLVAGEGETRKENPGTCLTIPEILKANVGKKVTIERQSGQILKGTLKAVLEEKEPEDAETTAEDAPPVHARADLRSYFLSSSTVLRESPDTAQLFIFDTGAEQMALPVGDVKSISGEEIETAMTRTTVEKNKRLAFRLDPEAAAAGETLRLMHFGPGVRWIPTYRVDIADAKLARVDLQAELMNEAEDIAGAAIDLVVGVPNFRFKGVVSPLSLETALRNALEAAAPQLMGQMRNDMGNAMFAQRAGEWRGPTEGGEAPADLALPPELTAGGAQDLYVYSIPELTLLKGQRAAVPVFTANVPFRHLYTWDVALQREPTEGVPGGGDRPSPLNLLRNDVWHQVELSNNTDKPWTTGAAFLLDKEMPLSQDLLTYTPAGGRVLVPVTVAIDVRGTYEEKEVGRDPNALTFDHDSYFRIRKTGALTLVNSKPEDLEVIVTCHFGGHADTASDDGAVTFGGFQQDDWQNYRGHPAVNQHSTIRWSLTLKKGETKTLEASYHYFTR